MTTDFRIALDPDDYARVMKTMNNLTVFERDAVVMQGLKEGAQVIVEQGQANILSKGSYDTGRLYDSVSVQVKKKNEKVYAGFKRGGNYGGSVAHLIDSGTKVRRTKKGYNRGKVTGNHFWREAVSSKSNEALNEVMESIEKSINKIINRN